MSIPEAYLSFYMLRGSKHSQSSSSLMSLNQSRRSSPSSANANGSVQSNSILRMEVESAPLLNEGDNIDDIMKIERSESMAYASHSPAGSLWSKFVHYARYNPKTLAAGIGSTLLVLALVADEMGSSSSRPMMIPDVGSIRGGGKYAREHWGGAVHAGYFDPRDAVIDERTFHFAAVTDLDKLSVVRESKKPLFRSTLLPGILTRDDASNRYAIRFEEPRKLVSQHNEAGRGMELSELTVYKDRLLSFDDRTGTVFEILSSMDGKNSYVVPRFVITEGDGDTDKGMKWEWATIKNNELIMGSMGKEFTNAAGEIENTNNLWTAVLNERGELRRDDWENKFAFVRKLVGAAPPGCK